jgi:hypothetical protein
MRQLGVDLINRKLRVENDPLLDSSATLFLAIDAEAKCPENHSALSLSQCKLTRLIRSSLAFLFQLPRVLLALLAEQVSPGNE